MGTITWDTRPGQASLHRQMKKWGLLFSMPSLPQAGITTSTDEALDSNRFVHPHPLLGSGNLQDQASASPANIGASPGRPHLQSSSLLNCSGRSSDQGECLRSCHEYQRPHQPGLLGCHRRWICEPGTIKHALHQWLCRQAVHDACSGQSGVSHIDMQSHGHE